MPCVFYFNTFIFRLIWSSFQQKSPKSFVVFSFPHERKENTILLPPICFSQLVVDSTVVAEFHMMSTAVGLRYDKRGELAAPFLDRFSL